MSIISLVFNKQIRTKIVGSTIDGQPVTLEIDSTPKINHTMNSTPTKNPIEDGSNVADHVTIENKQLIIDGVISNNPITFAQSIGTALTSRVTDAVQGVANLENVNIPRGVTGTIVGSIGRSLVTSEDRVQDAFRFMEELRDKRIPFRIVTSLKAYDDVVISKLVVNQTARDGQSLKFNMQLEEIKIVKTLFEQQTSVNNLKDDKIKATASKIVERGKQQAQEASAETQRKSTILFKGWSAVRGN